jgi:hypothetical protein
MKPARELEGGFSRRSAGWIIGIALGSLAAGVLLSVFGQGLAGRPDSGPNTFSRSAVGHHALVALLRGAGLGVVSRRHVREGRPGPRRPLVLAEPAAEGDAAARRLLSLSREAAGRRAPLLLVLPKRFTEQDPEVPGWIGSAALRSPLEVEQVPGELGIAGLGKVRIERRRHGTVRECRARLGVKKGGKETVYQIDLAGPAQLLTPAPGLDPVVVCDDGLLVARVSAAPVLFIVADPDLLENHGLGTADHAALVHDLLVRGLQAQGLIFDETIHGFARRAGLLAEALRFPLVLAVLQSLVLAGVVVWAGMGRFGKPLPVRGESRGESGGQSGEGTETLIDNTAQLLSVASGADGAAESLERYYRQTLRTVAAACFLPPDLAEGELLLRLQGIGQSRGSRLQIRSLARRIEQTGAAGPAAAERAVRLARMLHRWRHDMTLTRQTAGQTSGEGRDGHREHP